MGTLKKAALIAGGGLAVAAGGRALLRKKPKLSIGTPLSKSKVVMNNPASARKVAGRVVDMASRIDDHLKQFGAIDVAQEPWSSSYCSPCDSPSKPNFPTLYIDRSKDAGIMKMPGEGTAMVTYRVKRRNVDEDRDDGVPLYGANIEISSLEPIKAEVEEAGETGLESTIFLRQFAEGRERDGAGRFAAGHVPSPTDYAVAQASHKKKVAAGVGAGAVLAGAAVAGTSTGRKIASRIAGAGRNLLV